MTAPATLSMAATAAVIDMSWERFRKVWPTFVRHYRFPQPLERPTPTGKRPKLCWDEAAVKAWWAGRQRGRMAAPEHGAANDAHLPAATAHRVAVQRSQVAARMQRIA